MSLKAVQCFNVITSQIIRRTFCCMEVVIFWEKSSESFKIYSVQVKRRYCLTLIVACTITTNNVNGYVSQADFRFGEIIY